MQIGLLVLVKEKNIVFKRVKDALQNQWKQNQHSSFFYKTFLLHTEVSFRHLQLRMGRIEND